MTNKRIMTPLLCAAMLAAALLGCTRSPAPPDTAADAPRPAPATIAPEISAGVRFTDMGGNEIALPAPATRIVALTPADVEILFAIGAGDTLVGCGEYCDYPPEAQAIPVIQTGVEIDMERLLAVKPEVMLLNPQMLATGTVASTREQVARLTEAGVTVVLSNALTIDGVYEAISMLGTITGRTAQADAVIADMRKTFASVRDAADAAGKSVYFEISPLEYGLWAAGADTFMDEIASMIGLANAFPDITGFGKISEEQTLTRDPDYIVTAAMYFGEGPTPEEEIAARPGWENVTAVRTGAILSLRNNELSRPGPRLAQGARMLFDLVTGVE